MKLFAIATAVVLFTSTAAFAAGLSPSDKVQIAAQKICPISGLQLGAHGQPVKVKIGQEHIFICCKACLTKKVSSAHWATIHKNFAVAQRICPVMKKPLPAKAEWTIVNGRIFYVCCPPCIDKIKSNPTAYIKQLDGLYTASLNAKQPSR